MVTNMTTDSVIREKICERKDLWKSIIDLTVNYQNMSLLFKISKYFTMRELK